MTNQTPESVIAEAREALGRINIHAFPDDLAYQYRGGVLGRNVTEILRDVADALEAATRVPVQGEPNDVPELVDVVLTTADIEQLAHLLVQLSPATQKNSGATVRRLMQEMNIKEVEQ